ncbi:MAG: peptide deformylase [Parachlamydiales bacterium]|jgi:peptide deformylase
MLLRLAYYDDPFLRKKTKLIDKIDDSIRTLVENMTETMRKYDGMGLAAPQVFVDQAIFITCVPKQKEDGEWGEGEVRVFINPKILAFSQETWSRSEGCLSLPNFYEEVVRPVKIKIQATDFERESFEEELVGWDARAFLHENDHINGVLFIDRIKGKKRKDIEPILRMIKKKYQGK